MPDRDEPPPPPTTITSAGAVSRAAAGWQPVGGAFVASIVVHALLLACLVALIVRHDAPATRADAADSRVLTAILMGEPTAVQARTEDADSQAAATAPATTPRAPVPLPAPSPDKQSFQAPWSAIRVDVALPPTLFGQAMASEGVEWFETTNLTALGGDIEAKILRDYPVRPDAPVLLKPPTSIGYPLDALEAGVEGSVLVWFGVDEQGQVVDKEALDGPPQLMEWVLERVDRLVERPALVADRPVRSWVALEVHFSRASAEEGRARAAAKATSEADATAR